jgi:hypothetical protein
MALIGEFGRARAELVGEPDTFSFYGETFEVPAGISAVVLMDFVHETQAATRDREDAVSRLDRAQAKLAAGDGSERDRVLAEAEVADADRDLISAGNRLLVGMRAYVRGCLGEDDVQWRRFNDVCRREAVDSEELMQICAAIFSAVAARPTSGQSSLSTGLSSTGDGSTDGAVSLEATGGPRPPDTGSPVVGEVVELTPLERQRAAARAQMVPVSELLRRSGG